MPGRFPWFAEDCSRDSASVLLFYQAGPGKRGFISPPEKPAVWPSEAPLDKYEEAAQAPAGPGWAAEKKEGLLGPM
jgi:hypothetical protein